MLLADSICASRAFSESFRREMAAIFPDHKLEPIPVKRSAAEQDLRRIRPAARLAPRPGSRRPPASRLEAASAQAGPARVGGHQVRRSLGRRLLALRLELRPGEAGFAGMPRLHPRRRREDRTERRAVFVAAVGKHGRRKETTRGVSRKGARAQRTGKSFAPLRLCVRFFCSASFVLCFALIVRCGVLLLTPGAAERSRRLSAAGRESCRE